MRDRTHDSIAQITKELKRLRRNQGATWESYTRARLLGRLVGGNKLTFAKNLTKTIKKYAKDDRHASITLTALNLDDDNGQASGLVTARRRAAAFKWGANESTMMNIENETFLRIAIGLVKHHPDLLDTKPAPQQDSAFDTLRPIEQARDLVAQQEYVVAVEQEKLEQQKMLLRKLEGGQTP